MSLLELLKTGFGGQEASRRIFDNFRPIIHIGVTKDANSTMNLTQNTDSQFTSVIPAPRRKLNMSNPQHTFRWMLAGLIILSMEPQGIARADSQMVLRSPAIAPGATIASDFACTGADRSPELTWSGAPKSTITFALIVEDPDAPGGTFIHWVAYNIPAGRTSLPAGVPQNAEIPGGGTNGMNSFGHIGYNGPCPPPGKIHHYRFHLVALDSALSVGDGANAAAIESAIKGHVGAEAELTGTFNR